LRRIMAIEPCPFCNARIVPLMIGIFKKCPVCGRMWYDAGRGRTIRKRYGYGSGGAGAAEVYTNYISGKLTMWPKDDLSLEKLRILGESLQRTTTHHQTIYLSSPFILTKISSESLSLRQARFILQAKKLKYSSMHEKLRW